MSSPAPPGAVERFFDRADRAAEPARARAVAPSALAAVVVSTSHGLSLPQAGGAGGSGPCRPATAVRSFQAAALAAVVRVDQPRPVVRASVVEPSPDPFALAAVDRRAGRRRVPLRRTARFALPLPLFFAALVLPELFEDPLLVATDYLLPAASGMSRRRPFSEVYPQAAVIIAAPPGAAAVARPGVHCGHPSGENERRAACIAEPARPGAQCGHPSGQNERRSGLHRPAGPTRRSMWTPVRPK